MDSYTLYGTSACHLCEIAEEMIQRAAAQGRSLTLHKIDISESDDLFERYGLTIPVLANAAGAELLWPFSEEELERFLAV